MPTRKRKSKKQRKRKRDKDTDSSGDETPVEMSEDLLNRNASGPKTSGSKKDRTDADVQKKSSENTPADKSGCKGKRGENIEASAVEASAAPAGRVLLVCLRVLVMLLCSGACSRYQARLLTRRRRERPRRCQKMWRLR